MSSWALKAATLLTTSYVASSHMLIGGASSVTIETDLDTTVDYTSIQHMIEVSADATAWVTVSPSTDQSGIAPHSTTLANIGDPTDGMYAFTVPIPHGGYTSLRIQTKRTGGTAIGKVATKAYLGGQT